MNFDKIPKDGTTKTRKAFWDSVIDALGKSRKLPGRNVSVDERIGYGSVINVTREKSGGGCFSGSTVDVSFSGITFDCDCIPGSGMCSFKILSETLNGGTFTLPLTASGTGFVAYSLITSPTVFHENDYGDSNDCSTSPGVNDRAALIIVECHKGDPGGIPDGVYVYVEISGPFCAGDWVSFYAVNPVGSLTLSNTVSCNTTFDDGVFSGTGIAHSGTATVAP